MIVATSPRHEASYPLSIRLGAPSSQRFASGFLHIPPLRETPLLSASTFPLGLQWSFTPSSTLGYSASPSLHAMPARNTNAPGVPGALVLLDSQFTESVSSSH
ncbi:hypothetical protein ELY33_06215 [Vreelandella andesensis]|uniref:Uncharacterized protein n=1 Tax=Vreelandella andesensis TaxID=447567 RepID=A0A3S0Y7J5_9GAMM|nr:hypothetical protein [Halomonas andesensis]RUR32194.1 hypothetical protein ELY33_06215 [Halomonas andesensis]